jgi:4-hydroxy 2-oxovalerate aldolase
VTLADAWHGVSFLDCTLRDGGYYTAWDFDDPLVGPYLESMSRLPVAAVELGYCNNAKPGYFGKYYYLDASTVAWARSILRPEQQLGVMLDEKAVEPRDIPALLAPLRESVDLVRIAVAPTRLDKAADLTEALLELGFDVGVNVMYLSRYWESIETLEGLERAARLASAVSLVDSYGAVTPEQVTTAVRGLRTFAPDTTIGYHGHDNLGLAIANSLAAAQAGASIVDGTLTGMGRGPGNTKTELLLVQRFGAEPTGVDFSALEQAVLPFEALREQYGWGTNLAYMISGAAGLPQNQVMDWLGKNRYSVSAILHALHGDHVDNVDDRRFETLRASGAAGREVVVLGGGPSAVEHLDAVVEYAEASGAIVIHANYRHLDAVQRFTGEQYLCLAGDVAARLPGDADLQPVTALVVPSGPRFKGTSPTSDHPIREVAPFASATEAGLGPVSDIGPLALALGTALALEAPKVTLVGFDGYAHANSAQQDLAMEIQERIDAFLSENPGIEFTSATRTLYAIPEFSIYGRLAGLRQR